MMTTNLHHLLQYSQHPPVSGYDHTRPLYWDIRHPPTGFLRNMTIPNQPISDIELGMHATWPSVNVLRITTDLLQPDWIIEARNALGVTVRDVLEAIYSTLHSPLTLSERQQILDQTKQQERITQVFNARCAASMFPNETRSNGILRIDCFLQHTLFAGLSVITWNGDECVLSLRRHG
ncbi:hypothetical protein BDQ17DRAFT_999944 [Cyathus striatus]|nr:hypothetical protein BDQ17DRAFT_999944 [Cyathus striatus]